MADLLREHLSRIRTARDMIKAFGDERRCRAMLEAMVWPRGRLCPFCGYRRSVPVAGRDAGGRARPGLYQCASRSCRKQFTATTRTPLHATKLPIRTWLTAMWLILQSDKGLSSPRLAEALGVSQPTAWRIGHAVRLMLQQERPLGGIVEADLFYLGGAPRHDAHRPRQERGRQDPARRGKTPLVGLVERACELTPGAPAGEVRAQVARGGDYVAVGAVLAAMVKPAAHLMSDEARTFMALGGNFAAHDTVCHSRRDYVRGLVHTNSAEGLSDRIRRTVVGVFHHISPEHTDLYLGEIGFRWSQRRVVGRAVRRTRQGRSRVQTLWARTPPAQQLPAALGSIVGRQMRRSPAGGIAIKSSTAVFGR
jgi:hypothetical protein